MFGPPADPCRCLRRLRFGVVVDREKVLPALMRDERLTAIPATARQRRVIVEHVGAAVEPGLQTPER